MTPIRAACLVNGIAAIVLASAPLAGVGAAAAQEVIPTAQGAPMGGAPPAPPPGPVDIPHPDLLGADTIRRIGPCGGFADEHGKPDKSPHGEVHASVGTGGYREAGGIVCVPIGDSAAATVSIDAGRYPGWRPR